MAHSLNLLAMCKDLWVNHKRLQSAISQRYIVSNLDAALAAAPLARVDESEVTQRTRILSTLEAGLSSGG